MLNNKKYNNHISKHKRKFKRGFDLLFSFLGIIIFGIIILISYIIALIETGENGFFTQKRVGKNNKIFKVIKIRTMKIDSNFNTNVTTQNDPRITFTGKIFRKTKIDELPQLINVLKGDMSFVGPRPDVPEIINTMNKKDKRIILSFRPGITGPASLKYRNEEEILAEKEDPEKYNKEVIFPDKVEINKRYIKNYTLWKDVKYIFKTIFC